jgi:hypothetical protein
MAKQVFFIAPGIEQGVGQVRQLVELVVVVKQTRHRLDRAVLCLEPESLDDDRATKPLLSSNTQPQGLVRESCSTRGIQTC